MIRTWITLVGVAILAALQGCATSAPTHVEQMTPPPQATVSAVAPETPKRNVVITPPSPESIELLLTVTKAEERADTMRASVDQLMRQSMAIAMQSQQLSAEQQRVVDATRVQIVQVLREELAWDKMRPLVVKIYQETFTQEEIDGLIAFYRSPAGAAFVEKMPLVTQKSMSIMQSRIAPMMEKMRATIQRAAAEAKATK
jgi:uncharacterized protein